MPIIRILINITINANVINASSISHIDIEKETNKHKANCINQKPINTFIFLIPSQLT